MLYVFPKAIPPDGLPVHPVLSIPVIVGLDINTDPCQCPKLLAISTEAMTRPSLHFFVMATWIAGVFRVLKYLMPRRGSLDLAPGESVL